MTSRERVLAALNHQQPDRVPVDFGGHRSSGIAAIAYPGLRQYLGLPPKPLRVYDVIQQLAIVDDDVLERFGTDTIELGRGFALKDSDWTDWTMPDGTPCLIPAWVKPERDGDQWIIRSKTGNVIARMPDGALYFEQACFPFFEQDDLDHIPEALDEVMWVGIPMPPVGISDDELSEGARKFRQSTDRAIIGLFGGNLLEIAQFMYRIDKFLMMMAGDPKQTHRFLDKLVEMHLGNLEKYLGLVGGYIDIIVFGDDLGMQTGPQMSPAMYREYFKPRHKILWNRAKELADVKVMLHCCGGIREILPDMIEAGMDATNPVQTNCSGMDAAELKAQFGRDMTFWGGGCDTRDVLPRGTPEQVAEHVRKQVAILAPGGGFVFQQVHNILANVPPENIAAMFDAVKDSD